MGAAITAAVSWHIVTGVLVVIPILVQVARHRSSRDLHVSTSSIDRSFVQPILVVCASTGVALVVYASLGNAAIGWMSLIHIWAGISFCLVTIGNMVRVGFSPIREHSTALLVIASLGATSAALSLGAYRAEVYYRAITSTNALQARNPLFQAGTHIERDRESNLFPMPERCGTAGCHPEIVRDWSNSPHAHAADSERYHHALSRTERLGGTEAARWCQGCHSPISLIAETPLRADRPRSEIQYSKIEATGVDCLACHSISSIPVPTGNGNTTYSAPESYPFQRSRSGAQSRIHDFLLRVRPSPHKASFSSERVGETMCAPCHRQNVIAAQNHYKFLQVEDTWMEWHDGPFSGRSLHTFAPGRTQRTCVDCHMQRSFGHDATGRFIHDHAGGLTSAAVTATTPAARHSLSGALAVDIFALRRSGSEPGGTDRMDAPLSDRQAFVVPGERVEVDVLVRNISIAHSIPVSGSSLSSIWLELTITSEKGRILLTTSPQGAASPANTGLHRYGRITIDSMGKPLTHETVGQMVATVVDRPLYPGNGDVARFQFVIPLSAKQLIIMARLQARQTDRYSPRASLPLLLADDRIVLGVRSKGIPSASVSTRGLRDDPSHAKRFYAYGAALLQQHDVRQALRAFQAARLLAPSDSENWIGLARVHLEEGDLLSAREDLRTALDLRPRYERAEVWLGRTYRLMGQYDAALDLLRPLAARHPEDAQIAFDIGLCQLRSGRYEGAIEPFSNMLAIDPNEVSAHFNLMQCYRNLKRVTEARREEGIYRALHDDLEPARSIETYFRGNPSDRREAVPFHIHVLVPPERNVGAR